MAERKGRSRPSPQQPDEVEVESGVVPPPEPTPVSAPEQAVDNEFIKALVANFVQEHLQELQQRVSDLELLAAQPNGAVVVRGGWGPPPVPHTGQGVPDYVPEEPSQEEPGVPWYNGG